MKINKVLIFFLLLTSFLMIGAWNIVQSDWIGDKLSDYITNKVAQKLEAEISFKSLDIFLYPPAVRLNDVKLKKIDKDTGVDIQVAGLGIEFDTIKSMQKELTISRIYLSNGSVKIKTSQVNKPTSSRDSLKVSKYAKILEDEIPFRLNRISLKDIEIDYNEKKLKINELGLTPTKSSFKAEIDVSNFETNSRLDLIDKVESDLEIEDNALNFENIVVSKNKSTLELTGNLKNYNDLNGSNVDLKLTTNINIVFLNEIFNLKKIGEMEKGFLVSKGSFEGKLNDFKAKLSGELKSFKTPFCDGDSLRFDISANEKEIRVSSAKLTKDNQTLEVNKSFQFLDLNKMTFIDEGIIGKAKQLSLKNALKYLPKLSVLDAKVSGNIRFVLNEKDFHFFIDEKALLENTTLIINENKVLDIPKLQLADASFDINSDGFQMKTQLIFPSSTLNLEGSIGDLGLSFKTDQSVLKLEELGEISGMKLGGEGKVKFLVEVGTVDSYLKTTVDVDDFSINQVRQESLKADVYVYFRDSKLSIQNLESSAGRTKTLANAEIFFKDLSVNAEVSHKNIVLSEIFKSLNITNPIADIPIQGKWNSSYRVSGNLDNIKLEGEFFGENNLISEETFESIATEFSYENKVLKAQSIKIEKGDGTLTGEYILDTEKRLSNFNVNFNKILLEEISFISKLPLGINGRLSGKAEGEFEDELKKLNAGLYISNTKIPGKKLGDSIIKIKFDDRIATLNASLIGDKIIVNSENNLKENKRSTLNFITKIDDINEVIGTNRLVNLDETNILGTLYSTGKLEYELNSFKILNATVNLQQASFKKDNVEFNYNDENTKEIVIQSGLIKNWEIYLRGKNFYFISNAKGSFEKKLDLETDFKVDASIFEILNKVISKANGPIYGKYKISDLKDFSSQKLKLKTDGITISTANYPLRFEEIKFLVSADNEKLKIDRFAAKLGSGIVNVAGGVELDHLIPNIDIDFKFTHAGINLFEKSNLIFSGQGTLKGSRFPYKLDSNIYIERFNIINEFLDLISEGVIVKSDIKYLPNSEIYNEQNFIDFDINIKTVNPINIKNSMADLNFLANLKLVGNEYSPRARGSVYLAPGINKVYFKGNDYDISKANALFFENRKISNPELDIEASSRIDKYRLVAKVNGPVNNFDLDLRTDPYLDKSDILSLIAFGYTENTSASLSEEQRSLMTQAGIGSLLFERFKINETLKNELGIQLNLGTEVSTESESYLSQRSSTGNNGQRVTSATKIEVKKEITSDIDLSVSSTIGSGVGQRQRMNLDYKVSDKVSLEGVYENRTDSQSVNQRQDTSMGVDVRLRWTFK